MNIRHWIGIVAASCAALALAAGLGLLAGCPSHSTQHSASAPPPVARAAAFQGTLYGGRQPITGATVVAYASGTTVGAAPTEIGSNVTNSNGRFSITFSPAPRTGQVVYVTATGGNAGAGTNSAIGLMTIAGIQGSTLAPVPETVNINELTTVASTAVLQDYIQFADCSTITGNTQTGACLAIPGATGLGHMAATVGNLVNVVNGQASDFLAAYSPTAGAPLRATREKLDTLASVLAGCVNVAGPDAGACTGLFRVTGGRPNTLMSAWLVARMPAVTAKALALYKLKPDSPVFAPTLPAAPRTNVAGFWTVGGEYYVFTANAGDDSVSTFRLGVATGALNANVPGEPFDAGNHPFSVTVDPTGRYVYVVNASDGNVSAYTLDNDGTLTANGTVAAGSDPREVVVDPSGRYVYVPDGSGDSVLVYTIGNDGTLTANGTVTAGDDPLSIALDPQGRYAYVANHGSDDVSAYTIGSDSTLTAVGTAAAGSSPISVAVDPSGRYVYVANSGDDSVSAYKIETDGTLTANGTVAAGNGPQFVAVDPTGRYVYVINFFGIGGDSVSAYTIGSDGKLNPNGTVATGDNPTSIAVDPSGRYVYVSNRGSTVSQYTIDADGTLAPNGTVTTGVYPESIAVDPSGRYAYVANFTSGNISAYTIGSSGSLVAVGAAAAGSSPQSIVLDPKGNTVQLRNIG